MRVGLVVLVRGAAALGLPSAAAADVRADALDAGSCSLPCAAHVWDLGRRRSAVRLLFDRKPGVEGGALCSSYSTGRPGVEGGALCSSYSTGDPGSKAERCAAPIRPEDPGPKAERCAAPVRPGNPGAKVERCAAPVRPGNPGSKAERCAAPVRPETRGRRRAAITCSARRLR
ncbi:hypothetical protein [Saccharibacillus kuerlensis]|uniref:hypothetical protein n=1 Tax=Saccharibacillus kuerlensis TaxID=459527 RepID=UPI000475C869|nr:hypothetical protein [Saccharibacillus kuerlensis]